jgi:hypothetical protein
MKFLMLRYECHVWALQETGVDPSRPDATAYERVLVQPATPPGAGTAPGAIGGGILGSILAGPRNAGAGLVLGGRLKRRTRTRGCDGRPRLSTRRMSGGSIRCGQHSHPRPPLLLVDPDPRPGNGVELRDPLPPCKRIGASQVKRRSQSKHRPDSARRVLELNRQCRAAFDISTTLPIENPAILKSGHRLGTIWE